MTTTDVTLQDMFSSLGNVTNDSENSTVSPGQLVADPMTLNVPYTVCEVLVATCAVIGNALVIVVFRRERRLRRRTNYYIVSLAVADFLVGLVGIPAALLASVGHPHHLHACLFTVSLLVVLCTISIFCLVAVSVDRYWAILHPMAYSRNVRTKTAIDSPNGLELAHTGFIKVPSGRKESWIGSHAGLRTQV
uniref:G-protein coupled receptors family 1 profile domain-containing protein n=1 Tax=Timema monikensis TaxID=170555 RepID=A0A7R9DWP2_9NEOP|nr:unnamed protein product [Timema monikensis]